MRIGTNHGSLSDRIMSRYGDSPMGMVESAMEFLRVARNENYNNIVLSMKSSNPLVMVQAYRLLIQKMDEEFKECYPLHLGVTEAGDGEDGRIKSAIGIGTLMEDGIGDTIRVSLTEDAEFEIPVCKDLVKRYEERAVKLEEIKSQKPEVDQQTFNIKLPYSPFSYSRRKTFSVSNIGNHHAPIVIADFMKAETIVHKDLQGIGYSYDERTDKWNIGDAAADYIVTANKNVDFNFPGTLKIICNYNAWLQENDKEKYFPLFKINEYLSATQRSAIMNFVSVDANDTNSANELLQAIRKNDNVVICIWSSGINATTSIRSFIIELLNENIQCPVIICVESNDANIDEQLIHFSTETGALFLDGMGDGLWLMNDSEKMKNAKVRGRTYSDDKK